jgi:hypothetical protein
VNRGELILYTAEDRGATIHLCAEGGTVWLMQAKIAALFDTTAQNIAQHTKAIYAEAELTEPATCKERLQARQEGGRVRKQDVTVAKNYLGREEIASMDRTVVMYLDYAEDQALRRRTLTMRDWEGKLDAFLQFNEREVLTHAGKLRADVAEKLALERYECFDAARREAARLAADAEDLATLERTERQLEGKGRGKKK